MLAVGTQTHMTPCAIWFILRNNTIQPTAETCLTNEKAAFSSSSASSLFMSSENDRFMKQKFKQMDACSNSVHGQNPAALDRADDWCILQKRSVQHKNDFKTLKCESET